LAGAVVALLLTDGPKKISLVVGQRNFTSIFSVLHNVLILASVLEAIFSKNPGAVLCDRYLLLMEKKDTLPIFAFGG
jgi:hypothetical protein